jgi:hypothetical protein
MSETPEPPGRITFTGYRRPSLESGDYEITVKQNVSLDSVPFGVTRTFTVSGDRFTLRPQAVREVFPPDGSLGDHSNVLPHIVLDRPTLPWERDVRPDAAPSGDRPPWLALLVFSAGESPTPAVVTLGTLAAGPGLFPTVDLERHQADGDPVTVIDVPSELLRTLLPSYGDLRHLAHVRTGDGPDSSLVVAGRLPAPGVTTVVHLVSLEGRFSDTTGTSPAFGFGEPGTPIRLVSLASWRFACVDAAQTFPRMADGLASSGGTLRLPPSGEPLADAFLDQGFVPARHHLRQGTRGVAWYRGPLTTGPVDAGPVAPVRDADALLRFHPGAGMFDVGHAAAWQLGRLLILRSGDAATTLYRWRRRRDQNLKRATRERDDYPLAVPGIDDTLPASVLSWLTALTRLEGVPLPYLVPDERLLPVETIRFFGLDQQWMRHLVDGAYSLGRLSQADADLDAAHPLPLPHTAVTGCLIRSDLVSGYPGLLVDAYADESDKRPLPHLRVQRLTPDILLCLFDGVLARLDLHQSPESRHFAVELSEDDTFTKTLRPAGDDPPPATPRTPALPLGPLRTLPVAGLVSAMARALGITATDFTAGDFALQMIETAERVTFLRPATGG